MRSSPAISLATILKNVFAPPPPPAEVASLDKRKTNKNFKSLIFLNTVRKEIKYSGEIEILHKLVYDTTRINSCRSDFSEVS